MTWKRVATAAILIPVVVAIVLFTPTFAVAIATAIITILALREYFALGDAIGHRAYRFWTVLSALLLVFVQWRVFQGFVFGGATNRFLSSHSALVSDNSALIYRVYTLFSPSSTFFVFVLGLTVATLWTRRPFCWWLSRFLTPSDCMVFPNKVRGYSSSPWSSPGRRTPSRTSRDAHLASIRWLRTFRRRKPGKVRQPA